MDANNEPIVDPTKMTVPDKNITGICPAAQGDKDEQPVSYSPDTKSVLRPAQSSVHELPGVQREI